MGRTTVLPIGGIFAERCIYYLLIKNICCDSGALATHQSKLQMSNAHLEFYLGNLGRLENLGRVVRIKQGPSLNSLNTIKENLGSLLSFLLLSLCPRAFKKFIESNNHN
jgi:hypothetical protein